MHKPGKGESSETSDYEYEHVDMRTLSDARSGWKPPLQLAPHQAAAPPGPQLVVASQAAAAHPPAHKVATPPAPQTVPQVVSSSSGCTTKGAVYRVGRVCILLGQEFVTPLRMLCLLEICRCGFCGCESISQFVGKVTQCCCVATSQTKSAVQCNLSLLWDKQVRTDACRHLLPEQIFLIDWFL